MVMTKEKCPMNPLHWNREQWKESVQGAVLIVTLFAEMYFVLLVFG